MKKHNNWKTLVKNNNNWKTLVNFENKIITAGEGEKSAAGENFPELKIVQLRFCLTKWAPQAKFLWFQDDTITRLPYKVTAAGDFLRFQYATINLRFCLTKWAPQAKKWFQDATIEILSYKKERFRWTFYGFNLKMLQLRFYLTKWAP